MYRVAKFPCLDRRTIIIDIKILSLIILDHFYVMYSYNNKLNLTFIHINSIMSVRMSVPRALASERPKQFENGTRRWIPLLNLEKNIDLRPPSCHKKAPAQSSKFRKFFLGSQET